ncbi:hypothetical protein ON010_g9609 [Phytophthora cinnamomi]|nr:hypothetical protein ON010_g9609 [Phytophthora cinnamomi]
MLAGRTPRGEGVDGRPRPAASSPGCTPSAATQDGEDKACPGGSEASRSDVNAEDVGASVPDEPAQASVGGAVKVESPVPSGTSEPPRLAQDVVVLEDDSDDTSTPVSTFTDEGPLPAVQEKPVLIHPDEASQPSPEAPEPTIPPAVDKVPPREAPLSTTECVPNGHRQTGAAEDSAGQMTVAQAKAYVADQSRAEVPAVVGRRNGDVRAGPQHGRGHQGDHDANGDAVSPVVRGPRPDNVLRGAIQVSQPDPRVVPTPATRAAAPVDHPIAELAPVVPIASSCEPDADTLSGRMSTAQSASSRRSADLESSLFGTTVVGSDESSPGTPGSRSSGWHSSSSPSMRSLGGGAGTHAAPSGMVMTAQGGAAQAREGWDVQVTETVLPAPPVLVDQDDVIMSESIPSGSRVRRDADDSDAEDEEEAEDTPDATATQEVQAPSPPNVTSRTLVTREDLAYEVYRAMDRAGWAHGRPAPSPGAPHQQAPKPAPAQAYPPRVNPDRNESGGQQVPERGVCTAKTVEPLESDVAEAPDPEVKHSEREAGVVEDVELESMEVHPESAWRDGPSEPVPESDSSLSGGGRLGDDEPDLAVVTPLRRLEAEYARWMRLRDQLVLLPELSDLSPECDIDKADVGVPGKSSPAQEGRLRGILKYHRKIFLGDGNAAPAPARGMLSNYPLPLIDDLLIGFEGAVWFMSLDMASGFWAIRMTEQAKLISAFVCPLGHFQWVRMPFGLKNAPLIYQHVINNCWWGFVRLSPEEGALVDQDVLDFLKLSPDGRGSAGTNSHSGGPHSEGQLPVLTDQMTVFKRNIPAQPQMGPVLGRSSYIDDIAHGAATWDQLCDDLDALLYRLRCWNI